MAATVGNFIFHFIDDIKYSADHGFTGQLLGFQSFAFYCLALGVGIGISQMRTRRNKPYQSWVRRRLAPSVGVLIFYCLIRIFDEPDTQFSLGDHFSFFFHVMGIG